MILLMLTLNVAAIGSFIDYVKGTGLKSAMGGAIGSLVGAILRDAIYTFLFIGPQLFDPIEDALQSDAFLNILQQSNPELIYTDGTENQMIGSKVHFFIRLLAPFYLLALLFLAVYLMFTASSPQGRAKAKGSLLRLILSVGFIIFTIPIVQAFLDISLYITRFIIDVNPMNMELALEVLRTSLAHIWWHMAWKLPFFAYWLMVFLLLFTLVVSLLPFIVIGMRFFMIIVFTMLFPVGIFLYSLHFTQGIGKSIIKQTIYWISIQPLMTLILAVIGIAYTPLHAVVPDGSLETGFGLAGFLALGAAPLIMVGVLNWLEILAITFSSMEAPLMGLVGMQEEEMELE